MFIYTKSPEPIELEMELTEEFLALFKQDVVDPEVAGGAPRDWFFNKLSKDIDIFVNHSTDMNSLLQKLKNNTFVDFDKYVTTEELPENYRSIYISSVISFKFKGKDFQIIQKALGCNLSAYKYFPASICCITYKNFTLFPSKIFLNGLKHAEIYMQEDLSENFRRKILMKFPRFRWIAHENLIYD